MVSRSELDDWARKTKAASSETYNRIRRLEEQMMTVGISPRKQGSTDQLCVEDRLEEMMKEQAKMNQKLLQEMQRLIEKFEELLPEREDLLVDLTKANCSTIRLEPPLSSQRTISKHLINSAVTIREPPLVQPKSHHTPSLNHRQSHQVIHDRLWIRDGENRRLTEYFEDYNDGYQRHQDRCEEMRSQNEYGRNDQRRQEYSVDYRPHRQVRTCRLGFSVFSGDDPGGGILRSEKFCRSTNLWLKEAMGNENQGLEPGSGPGRPYLAEYRSFRANDPRVGSSQIRASPYYQKTSLENPSPPLFTTLTKSKLKQNQEVYHNCDPKNTLGCKYYLQDTQVDVNRTDIAAGEYQGKIKNHTARQYEAEMPCNSRMSFSSPNEQKTEVEIHNDVAQDEEFVLSKASSDKESCDIVEEGQINSGGYQVGINLKEYSGDISGHLNPCRGNESWNRK
jgi:hypothetical protein